MAGWCPFLLAGGRRAIVMIGSLQSRETNCDLITRRRRFSRRHPTHTRRRDGLSIVDYVFSRQTPMQSRIIIKSHPGDSNCE